MAGITAGESSFKIVTMSYEAHSLRVIIYFVFPFRFLAPLSNVSEVEELKYTMEMIDSNFSNYSAWHNRRYCVTLLS